MVSTTRRSCWSCESQIGGEEIFCKSCSKIQSFPKEIDYFRCLGLGRLLNLDVKELEKRFYDLSRQFHPDFYYGKGKTEQDISLENSALLNKSYRTLKDPFSRVEYLILLEEGGKDSIAAKVPQEFLEEVFELQESLEEYRSATDPKIKERLEGKLREALKMLEGRLSDLDKNLFELWGRWDQVAGNHSQPAGQQSRKSLIHQMREILSYRTYFKNLIQDIDPQLEGHTKDRGIRP